MIKKEMSVFIKRGLSIMLAVTMLFFHDINFAVAKEYDVNSVSVNDTGSEKDITELIPVDENIAFDTTAVSDLLDQLSGEGTKLSPYFIQTVSDMKSISGIYSGLNETVYYFKLTKDIDLSDTEWTPIRNFAGVLDGDGHEVILKNSSDYSGVCYTNSGIIENLTLICAEGSNIIYPLCNTNDSQGTIRNCTVNDNQGEVIYDFFGMLYDNQGIIENCDVNLDIVAKQEVCGMLYNNNGEIKNCRIGGSVQLNGEMVSATGVVIFNKKNISNTICSLEMTHGKYDISSGAVYGASGFVTNNGLEGSFADAVIDNCSFTGKINGFNSISGFCSSNSAKIENCRAVIDLEGIAESGSMVYDNLCGFVDSNTGTTEKCISQGKITSKQGGRIGGFSYLNQGNGIIKECDFDGNINAHTEYIGAIAVNNTSRIELCKASGTLSGQCGTLGGIVGRNSGIVTKCFWNGELQSNSYTAPVDVGGIAGYNFGTITESMSKGKIVLNDYCESKIEGIFETPDNVGGIVGVNSEDSTGDGGIISDCMADMDISHTYFGDDKVYPDVGGVVGCDFGSIVRCYSSGTMILRSSSMGGIYAEGSISYVNEDGIFTSIPLNESMVNSNFFMEQYTKPLREADKITEQIGCKSLTLQQMRQKETYTNAGWDFDTVWAINADKNDGFPYPKFAEDILPEQTHYNMTIHTTAGGKTIPEGSFAVYTGEQYYIRFEPENGYKMISCLLDGTEFGAMGGMVPPLFSAQDHTMQVTFEKQEGQTGSANENTGEKDKGPLKETMEYAIGTKIMTTDGKSAYIITDASKDNPTVSFAGTTETKKKSISIPSEIVYNGVTYKVTEIADKALKNNKNITSVKMPTGITKIGDSVFEGCNNLKTITIGSKVTSIGKNTFKNCKKLTKITIKSKNIKKVGKGAFKGISDKCKIKVPSSKLKSYQKLLKGKGQKKSVKITK